MNKFQINKKEYNDEPVEACDTCNSLKIIEHKSGLIYCGKCGNTHIIVLHILDWELKEKAKK